MQNSLIPFDIEDALEGVLVPGKILKARDRAMRIIEQAQNNASKIIKQANLESKEISESAFNEGYQAGIMLSFNSVADYLQNSNALYHEFYTHVNQTMRHNLKQALGDDEVFSLIIKDWLQKLAQEIKESHQPLILLIPQHSPNLKTNLLEFIKTIWQGDVQLHQHDENRYVIKHANKIAEFSPEQWIKKQKIKTDYLSHLENQLTCLSGQAMREFINMLSTKLIKETPRSL
ncbi:hypothetical protein SC206_19825 [Rouxiella sp. T17]|uniref:hypothetical protein n=1 Tax=Rouxiella sp. T17 TaxID=3085684 RepID=UPI002FC90DDD